jgi:nucleotide-binding universal stress UspA family protein
MGKVLVAVDGSECSKEALVYALEVCTEDEITVVHVPVTTMKDLRSDEEAGVLSEERGRRILEQAAETAEGFGREVKTEMVHGDVSRAVVSYAEENGIDRILMGSRGAGGTKRVLLGSVAENLVRRAGCPVTVVR